MKITLFTSNQPRHINFARLLSSICDELWVVVEGNTIFPGRVDDFYKKSPLMKKYFSSVMNAEKRLFGDVTFFPQGVRPIFLKMGDLNYLDRNTIQDALNSDLYIVFGSSYIKGWLADFLVSERAINTHIGVSPFYRGSSCNFWAVYDKNPHLVGATVHELSKGLDSGAILYHAIPLYDGGDIFEYTMKSVLVAQKSVVERIKNHQLHQLSSVLQDKEQEVRYSKYVEFTDSVLEEFYEGNNEPEVIQELIREKRDESALIRPFYG